MSADDRVDQAREFLHGTLKRTVDTLPPTILMRELAECRRQLGQVLIVVDDGREDAGKLAEIRAVLAAFDWAEEAETWLDVPGYEGLYEVSDLGQVFSVPRADSLGRAQGGQMLKQVPDGKGYPLVTLHKDGKPRAVNVYHLVTDAFLGPCPPGLERRHLDGDKLNSRLSNLVFGTGGENAEDKIRHGTTAWGTRNPHAKLTPELVQECRQRRAAGATVAALALEYGITPSAMSKAVRGDTWAASPGRRRYSPGDAHDDRQYALEEIERIADGAR